MREALLLDLGAIIFELHRQRRREPDLLQAKAAELDTVDAEVRALAHALDEGSGLPELTARGLVAACTACGSLMGSHDRFCPHCGAAAGALLPVSENGAGSPELPGDDGDAPALGQDGDAPALEERPEQDEAVPAPAAAVGDGPPPPPPDQDDIVKLAQSKMRAGRRAARRWLTERRPEGR
jgi:hypothetical protein